MNNDAAESIVKRMMTLEEEKKSLLNSFEKEAIAQLQQTTHMIISRPWDYVISQELKTAVRDLVRALEATADDATETSHQDAGRRQRVNRSEKDRLFAQLIDDFKTENPDTTQITFKELTDRLKAKGHSPNSVSVFFRTQLEGKATEGNTRSKVLLLDEKLSADTVDGK